MIVISPPSTRSVPVPLTPCASVVPVVAWNSSAALLVMAPAMAAGGVAPSPNRNVPASIWVAPPCTVGPASVRRPDPAFNSAMPLMGPVNAVLVPSPPTLRVLKLSAPAPDSEAITLGVGISTWPPASIVSGPPLGKGPASRAPTATVVAPVCANG